MTPICKKSAGLQEVRISAGLRKGHPSVSEFAQGTPEYEFLHQHTCPTGYQPPA